MRKFVAFIGAVAVVSAVVSALAAAWPASGAPTTTTTLTFKEVTTQFYFTEHPETYPKPPGRGAGNMIEFTGELFTWQNGPRQGINHGYCLTVADNLTVVTNPEGPGIGTPVPTPPGAPAKLVAQCQQTVSLAGGDIQIEGMFDQLAFEGDCVQHVLEQFCTASTETLAVVGGTGQYAGVWGVANLTQIEYPDVVKMELVLHTPR